jgi:hypothetical protein
MESTTAACVEKRKLVAGRCSSEKRSFPAIQSGS